jgi:CheY-like chemotaxis protein
VYSAGKDLLSLINQILDLAKIEAGRQELYVERVPLKDFLDHARSVFAPLAADKGLLLVVEGSKDLPASIVTDRHRVERILTNLLGNAIKFTSTGEVRLSIKRPERGVKFRRDDLSVEKTVAFAVSDTGIGIPAEAREQVFAPFEQLESKTDRRYGGTGLGLAIARESSILLGGELQLESQSGKGSVFTCYLPEASGAGEPLSGAPEEPRITPPAIPGVTDDRSTLRPAHPHLLVIEDDPVFAEQLVDVIRARRLQVLVATTGQEGLALASTHNPQGIILDVRLPDIDGWAVMDRLRTNPKTKGIPVHFISSVDAPERGFALGAIGYLTKPTTQQDLINVVRTLAPSASQRSSKILVVEDNAETAESVVHLLRGKGIEASHVGSARGALDALAEGTFACMILDLGLPDMDGLGLLEALEGRADIDMPPVVVYTARALTKEETRRLEAYVEAVVLKDGNSEARLLEELRLFVGHLKETLPRSSRPPPERRVSEVSLEGAKILLADDDMRTVYALSALLRGKGADVIVADTGKEALDLLAQHPDVNGVLMDVMMPEMDGYEAMRRLRRESRFERLPVIALTAKAMRGERERCLEAGASDYLAKPVDGDRLLATLDTWLKVDNAPKR